MEMSFKCNVKGRKRRALGSGDAFVNGDSRWSCCGGNEERLAMVATISLPCAEAQVSSFSFFYFCFFSFSSLVYVFHLFSLSLVFFFSCSCLCFFPSSSSFPLCFLSFILFSLFCLLLPYCLVIFFTFLLSVFPCFSFFSFLFCFGLFPPFFSLFFVSCCDVAVAQINYPGFKHNTQDIIVQARGRTHEEVLVQIFMLYDVQIGGFVKLSMAIVNKKKQLMLNQRKPKFIKKTNFGHK